MEPARIFIFLLSWSKYRSLTIAAVVNPTVMVTGEEIRHHVDAGVAGMVQAGQPETTFERFEQREVSISLRALHATNAVVCIHDYQYLVRVRRDAVVVFVPHQNDGIAAFLPGPRGVDRFYQRPDGEVAQVNQPGVESDLRAGV